MENKGIFVTLFIVVTLGVGWVYYSQGTFQTDIPDYEVEATPPLETSEGYGVSSTHPLAVKVGMQVLKDGGNAVDAAVAVSYMLGVVEPYGSGIGGGGEMLVLPSGNEEPVNYKYKEIAPPSGGSPTYNFAVPGMVKGMEAVHEDFGTVEMAQLLDPAIQYASYGFQTDAFLTGRLKGAAYRMRIDELDNFYPGGTAIEPNEKLRQPELASTMKKIQEQGSDALYSGEITDEIVSKVRGITKEDFESYEVVKNEPVQGEFAGYQVYSSPPPLAGVTLIQSLQMAEMLDIEQTKGHPADYIHLIGEISKRTYDDRLSEIGDPRFYENDIQELTTKPYSEELASTISMDKLSDQYEVNDSEADIEDHDNTTHFVVVDKNGMMVSATHTLSNFFGSGRNIAGIFLNDTMRNFSISGLPPNNQEPGKRPRSFTAPTILTNGEKVIGIGTPGGKRIPMVLTQVLTQNLLFNEPIEEAIQAPRFYIEDNNIFVEKEFDKGVRRELEARGYNVYLKDSPFYYGGVQALVVDRANTTMYGGADSRRDGTWQVNQE
ncbi:gamma-glutamyltransferase [Halobacillus faecis]|nr:gamma-glutamyltransferase [Halobacillus faecis]